MTPSGGGREEAAGSARPTPETVRAWFTGPLSEKAVYAYLLVLMRDPDWVLVAQPAASTHILTLHYRPTDATVVVSLTRIQDHWQATTAPPAP